MMVSLFRLVRTERFRVLLVLVGIVTWMLLLLLVYKQLGVGVFKGMDSDSAGVAKGFDIRAFASPDGVLANLVGIAYTHPLFLALVGSIAIGLGARSCAGELESGTLELTLSRPIARWKYLTSYIVFMNAALILMMLASALAVIVGSPAMDTPGRIGFGAVMVASFGGFLLYSAFAALTMLISVLVRSRSAAMMGGLALLVVTYFVEFISRLWPAIESVGVLSPFHYFQPTDMLIGNGLNVGDAIALVTIIGVANAFALWRFEHRDLV